MVPWLLNKSISSEEGAAGPSKIEFLPPKVKLALGPLNLGVWFYGIFILRSYVERVASHLVFESVSCDCRPNSRLNKFFMPSGLAKSYFLFAWVHIHIH